MGFVWVLIPLAAIAVGGFSEWLKFKRETAQLGLSTNDLQQTVDTLTAELESMRAERLGLVKRLQNLEAIVTSEAWDTLNDDRALAAAQLQTPLLDDEEIAEDNTFRAQQLARRLRS